MRSCSSGLVASHSFIEQPDTGRSLGRGSLLWVFVGFDSLFCAFNTPGVLFHFLNFLMKYCVLIGS